MKQSLLCLRRILHGNRRLPLSLSCCEPDAQHSDVQNLLQTCSSWICTVGMEPLFILSNLLGPRLLFTFSPPWKKQAEYLICTWISPLELFIQGSVSVLSFSFRTCCFCTAVSYCGILERHLNDLMISSVLIPSFCFLSSLLLFAFW